MIVLIIGIVLICVSLFVVINNILNAIKNLRDDLHELSREIEQDNKVNKQKLNEIKDSIKNIVYIQELIINKKKKNHDSRK